MTSEECYCCCAHATTVEHTPPKCLFPEEKDIPSGVSFRRNLVTVPSCAEHNLKKSGDDEYLMYVLAMNLPANTMAENHFKTKIIRAIKRRPALINSFISSATPVGVVDQKSGEKYDSLALNLDFPRLQSALEKIALGIYRHHFGSRWTGSLKILPEFLRFLDTPEAEEMNSTHEQIGKLSNDFFNKTEVHGENPEIFNYQIGRPDKRAYALLKLRFYGEVNVLALFENKANIVPLD